MGQIQSTYSYRSNKDAWQKMANQLNQLDIPLCYSEPRQRYFIYERGITGVKMRRYFHMGQRVDVRGKKYYECSLV
jgi:hypothetical protein